MKQLISIPYILNQLDQLYDNSKNRYREFIESNKLEPIVSDEEEISSTNISVPQEKIDEYDKLYTEVENIVSVSSGLLITQFIDIVTQFDSFLQNLMRCIYNNHPEILNKSEKTITFKQLMEYGDISIAKNKIVEDTLDEIFRGSHKQMLEHLTKITSVDVAKELPSLYKKMIEMTERRNLFVHCRGVVSGQYVRVCNENKIPITVSEGDQLKITKDYFIESVETLLELVINFSSIIWKKQMKPEKNEVDQYIIKICDWLVSNEKYDIAIQIIDYLLAHHDNDMSSVYRHQLKTYKIHAHKCKGEVNEVKAGLSDDWSSVNPKIDLTLKVLSDQSDKALEEIEHIGKDKAFQTLLTESHIFSDFVKHPGFNETYKKVYEADFCYFRKPLK